MTAPLLRVRDLVVEFPVRGGTYRGLDGVGLDVEKGRTLAVVGESGSGKSTLARSLVRLIRPTSGTIELDGTDIATLSERRLRPMRSRIQMVFQDPYGSLDPHLSAQEIIAEPLRQRGMRSRAERLAEAARLVDLVHLPSSALERKPSEFSGGQRQRIGIARALASSPEVLVCDEATSALDVSVQAQVLRLLAELQETTGVTYVFISHNLAVVREVSQEVVVLERGRIVESGPTERVLASPVEPYTRRLRAAALDPLRIRGTKEREVLRMAERIA
ncbi:MAG: ATP-binding cassette domain-containing protein [Microbacterium sp.]